MDCLVSLSISFIRDHILKRGKYVLIFFSLSLFTADTSVHVIVQSLGLMKCTKNDPKECCLCWPSLITMYIDLNIQHNKFTPSFNTGYTYYPSL